MPSAAHVDGRSRHSCARARRGAHRRLGGALRARRRGQGRLSPPLRARSADRRPLGTRPREPQRHLRQRREDHGSARPRGLGDPRRDDGHDGLVRQPRADRPRSAGRRPRLVRRARRMVGIDAGGLRDALEPREERELDHHRGRARHREEGARPSDPRRIVTCGPPLCRRRVRRPPEPIGDRGDARRGARERRGRDARARRASRASTRGPA